MPSFQLLAGDATGMKTPVFWEAAFQLNLLLQTCRGFWRFERCQVAAIKSQTRPTGAEAAEKHPEEWQLPTIASLSLCNATSPGLNHTPLSDLGPCCFSVYVSINMQYLNWIYVQGFPPNKKGSQRKLKKQKKN